MSDLSKHLHAAADIAAQHLEELRRRPVFRPMTEEERQTLLSRLLPETGTSMAALLDVFRASIEPFPMGNGHPRFFGWVNSPPTGAGIVAEMLAAAMNPSCAGGDHAGIYLEHCVVRWLMELLGFPTQGSMGLLVGGGSAATITAFAAARHAAIRRMGFNSREDGLYQLPRKMILYVSSEGHSCLWKAVELLGLGRKQVRVIPVDGSRRMDVTALRSQITADRRDGHEPFCVAASAGTVNTGAIDPLNELAGLCRQEGLWLHVDGSYGAVGILVPDRAHLFAGLDRADSIALDPHKWLSVPVECGCVLVRDADNLRDTFSYVPSYLKTNDPLPWYSEFGMQQTRAFRALKLWMTLEHFGCSGLVARLTRHVRLAEHLAALVDKSPDLERLADVSLSIVCFRYAPKGLGEEDMNGANEALARAIQRDGRAFVTGTRLGSTYALRACILHDDTAVDDLALLIDVVRELGRQVVLHGETEAM